MTIPFTQFLRPAGRVRQTGIDMPENIEHMAHQLIDLGYRFEAEILTTGEVSLTCENGDELLSIQLCANGPPVLSAVENLVIEAIRKAEEQMR